MERKITEISLSQTFLGDFFISVHSIYLEYYRGSLDQSHKILHPVSTYLKGNCGIEFLLNAYCLLRQSTLPGQAE